MEKTVAFWQQSSPSKAFDCLYTLMRHHQFAMDICSENIANANTCKTADGTPFRRKVAWMTGDVQSHVEQDRGGFRWVYDPTHPDSGQQGDRRGYLACPSLSGLLQDWSDYY